MSDVLLKSLSSHLNGHSLDDLSNDLMGRRWASYARIWRPQADVYETEDALIIRVEIAGVRESDFQISLEERRLQISGTRADISERRAYYQMEIPYGDFNLELNLPVAVVGDEAQAVYRNGLLKIVLPKAHPKKAHPKQIPVRGDE